MNAYFERLRSEVEKALGDAGAASSAQVPAGKWTPAQILEHLFLSYKHTNRALEKCMEGGAPSATRATFKDRLASMVVITFGHIPNGRKAPERAIPRGMPLAEVLPAFTAELQRLDAKLHQCESRFGARTKIIDHPFIGPLTAGEWRKFHWVHGRHHARQIRERVGGS